MSKKPAEARCRNCGAPLANPQAKHCPKCAQFLEPTERLEIKVSKHFAEEIEAAMAQAHYRVRAEFIREAIRYFIRYLKGEVEEKNVIEGVLEHISLKRQQNLRIIREATDELEGIP